MKKDELEFLQAELIRISDLIKFADQKVAFLSLYFSALFSFCINHKNQWVNSLKIFEIDKLVFNYILLLSLSILLIFGFIFLALAIFPRTTNNLVKNSLFYYGSVSRIKLSDFQKAFKKTNDESCRQQMLEQIFTNSCIASSKMECIKLSSMFLIAIIPLIAIIMFQI